MLWCKYLIPWSLSLRSWEFKYYEPPSSRAVLITVSWFCVVRHVALGAQHFPAFPTIPSRELPNFELPHSDYRFPATVIALDTLPFRVLIARTSPRVHGGSWKRASQLQLSSHCSCYVDRQQHASITYVLRSKEGKSWSSC